MNYNNKKLKISTRIDRKGHGIIGLIRDITSAKKFETDIIKAKEKAEESDRLKSAFITNMSHEIRTPMNGILGFARMLNNKVLTDEKQKLYSNIIVQSGHQLLNIVNDILDISRIESGKMELRKDVFDNVEAPFVLSRLSDNQWSSLGAGPISVRKAQTEVPGVVNNVACIDTDDDILFTTRKDRIHFNANGQINMGKLLAEELIKLNGGTTTIIEFLVQKGTKGTNNQTIFQNLTVTTVSFSFNLTKPTNVVIKIYTVTGREIKSITNNYQSIGQKTVSLEGFNKGLYLVQLTTNGISETKKLLLK